MSDMPSNLLAQLIDEAEDANGWSDNYVATRAQSMGHELSKSSISLIRRNGIRTLVPGQLRALADGLDLPLQRVVRAALATIDLPVPAGDSGTAEDAIRADEDLSLGNKRMLLAMLDEARNVPRPQRRRRSDDAATITAIDERRSRPPAEKRAARRPKDGPNQPLS